MCGIVGYIGDKPAIATVIDELKRLEYRGYDSAGVAMMYDGKIEVIKTVGKIRDLEKILGDKPASIGIALGHTRWATHGAPSTPNAHPLCDCTGRLAVVHNGVIENYLALKEELQAKGHRFTSETDTEVIAHLIEEHLKAGNLEAALRAALRELRGYYALVVISEDEPGKLFVARRDNPLVIGLGQGENFIASDIPALLPYTRQVYILEDGDIGIIGKDSIALSDMEGRVISRPIFNVTWDATAAEKGGFEHFMLKEIHEIPRAIHDTLQGRVTADHQIALEEIKLSPEEIRGINRLFIVACGTAYHAGCVGKYLFEKLLRIPVEVDIASEFRYRNPIITKDSLVIIISQSGETTDTLAALREARRQGAKVLGIVNVMGSSIFRESDEILPTRAGPEICVASTKAYITQLIALYLLTLHFGKIREQLPAGEIARLIAGLKLLPEQVQHILDNSSGIVELSKALSAYHDFFFIGRGLDYPASLEAALKLKEISYIHADSYAAGELKHGPLALITDGTPVVAMCLQSNLYEKMLSNVKIVAARGARIIAIVKENDRETEKSVAEIIRVPEADDLLTPVLAIIPPYLLTYYIAKYLDREIDQPRNLAKSVTVE